MKKILFKKFSGAGNDFILIDQNENEGFIPGKDFIIAICKRRFGVGADGLLFIKNSLKSNFELEFFNSDGKPGSLCGNGSRCAIQYAGISGRTDSNLVTFECDGVNYKGELLNEGLVKFYLDEISLLKETVEFLLDNINYKSGFVENGSPHVVLFLAENKELGDLENIDINNIGQKIRFADEFKPSGANINFVQLSDNKIFYRTFERGVEEETLACGTGAVAVAALCNIKYGIEPPITLIPQSQEELTVNFNKGDNGFADITLTGPAKLIYTGEFYINEEV